MTTDRLLDLVGVPGGPLADAALFHLQVTEAQAVTPTFQRVVLTAPGLEGLRFEAGQDLMLRIPQAGDRVVNRRYTIRDFDPDRATVTIDVSLHGAGPGTDWIRAARIGDRIDGIGPRGKITLREDPGWHLFVADETGVPGGLAMIEDLPPGSAATAVFEVDTAADELDFRSPAAETVEVRWLHRDGRSRPGDPSLIVEALGGVDMPAGTKHAYVAAEAGVVRRVRAALLEHGLDGAQISAKAYWRRGLPNAEHGEPAREE